MKLQKIALSMVLSMILIFTCSCSCGGKLKFDKTVESFEYGKTYNIPCSNKDCTFTSSSEEVLTIENGKIVPISGGFSIITATKGDESAKMYAIITGITHPRNNLKITTTNAKVYNNSENSTIGITLSIENLGNSNFVLESVNEHFSIFLTGETQEYHSNHCRLVSDTTLEQDIILKPSTESNKKVTEIIVYFELTNIPPKIFSTSSNTYFNVSFFGLTVGALKVEQWIYA